MDIQCSLAGQLTDGVVFGFKYVQGMEIGFDACLEDDIIMEHKNLKVQMSELSSSVLVPTYLSTRFFFWHFSSLKSDVEYL